MTHLFFPCRRSSGRPLFLLRLRLDGLCSDKQRTICLCTLMHRETEIQRQAVYDFPTVAHLQIQVIEIIQIHPIEIENTVRHIFQFIQHPATVNTVPIAHTHVKCRTFAWPVVEVRPDRPIKLFIFKVITQPGDNTQQAVTRKKTIVLEFLPV